MSRRDDNSAFDRMYFVSRYGLGGVAIQRAAGPLFALLRGMPFVAVVLLGIAMAIICSALFGPVGLIVAIAVYWLVAAGARKNVDLEEGFEREFGADSEELKQLRADAAPKPWRLQQETGDWLVNPPERNRASHDPHNNRRPRFGRAIRRDEHP